MTTTGKIGPIAAASIAIGGMVGGGIFAVLGLAVTLAKGATPLAFSVAGIITIFTAYSYSKLSLAYPSSGGTIVFVNKLFGDHIFSGGMNNLLWVSYIIMLSLYATAFGSYAPNLLSITGDLTTDKHLYISLVILGSALLNYFSIKIIGDIESIVVVIKLTILLIFVVVGFIGLPSNTNLSQLSPAQWEPAFTIIASGMVIFVAYEGFELIANSAPNIINPKKNIPLSYYGSVFFVILLYIAIAVVTVGSLDFAQLVKARDYALAEAAKPMLGQAGFTIITIAALLSTFSAINATLLGGNRVNFQVAESDELPHCFTRIFYGRPIGLLIITILTLFAANVLDLESISNAGSTGFLLIFACVNYVAFKMAKTIQGNSFFPLMGCILAIIAVIVLTAHQVQVDIVRTYIAVGIIATCFVVETIYKLTLRP